MIRGVKSFLKRFEPFRTIAWAREQSVHGPDPRGFRHCGRNVRITPQVTISHPHLITIGDNVVIHRGVTINGGGGLVIGNNVGISYQTTIWTLDHTFHGGQQIPFDDDVFMRPVLIHDNVAIGANVCITPGVEVGEGAIIGMGAVVTSDVRPLAVMFGNPARVIGYRDKDHYERCKAEGRFFDFGETGRAGRKVVPVFVQNRPKLYEIIRSEVEAGRAVLEPDPEAASADGAAATAPGATVPVHD